MYQRVMMEFHYYHVNILQGYRQMIKCLSVVCSNRHTSVWRGWVSVSKKSKEKGDGVHNWGYLWEECSSKTYQPVIRFLCWSNSGTFEARLMSWVSKQESSSKWNQRGDEEARLYMALQGHWKNFSFYFEEKRCKIIIGLLFKWHNDNSNTHADFVSRLCWKFYKY